MLLHRLFIGLTLLYGLLIGGIEWFAKGIEKPFLIRLNATDEPIIAVVFYTDDAKTRNDRLQAAIAAFRDGKTRMLLMAGGNRPQRKDGYNGARNMRHEAIILGVPEGQVMTDSGSNDTVSNLLSAVGSLKGRFEKPFKLALFSDRFQLLRLSLIVQITDLKEPMLQQPILFVEAGELPTGFNRWSRLNHEILAYLSLLLPDTLTKNIFAQMRGI
jgi:DUF218 domain